MAGSTATIAEVVHNGATVGTLTIPANELVGTVSVSVRFEIHDIWQMRVTTAGTGALGGTFFGRFT